jgi:hypothetical protein
VRRLENKGDGTGNRGKRKKERERGKKMVGIYCDQNFMAVGVAVMFPFN